MNDLAAFQAALLSWFEAVSAAFPWREMPTPYRVWLSEMMLQQTQVATVIPYFTRFLARYPDVQALAAAPLDEVLKAWEGLGYYTRARNLHRAAQMISQHGGNFPNTVEGLQTLPGVGRYTASAVASIAFGVRTAVLDGNVIRVLSRLYDLAEDVSLPATQKRLWSLAEGLITDSMRPGDHNQAMMELGREVCKPRKPVCAGCPVQPFCKAFQQGTQASRPIKALKPSSPHYHMASGVILNRQGQVLIAQRPLEGLLGGLWEFPAGKCEGAESPESCLERTLRQSLGVEIEGLHHLLQVKHAFTHFKITVQVFEGRFAGGTLNPHSYPACQWVNWDEIGRFAFGKVDRKVIDHWQTRGNRLW